ncbi:flagellar hook-associated protein FlgK [Sphingomonas ginkgonis]|uniref:Flagellar hook-associated protein 1 n=1 Tax=Sphingomonas ginkgonis TaxID=2315330 RepID=A0A429VCB2_9SPHN|nr:flagellar hook-associated protein FlgK [Sphingomonas ginkgonis]RST31541.1 flagellar hook-associated protein FlgK [Sphingomonas ginkgonis]
MTDLMSIGASGLRAYRDALGTTSDNIANAQSPGYVRRTLQLSDAPAGGDVRFYSGSTTPGGVMVGGVQRSVDQWLVEDARSSAGGAERSAARLAWLQAGERGIDDGAAGVGQSLTGMFNAADTLASDPASTANRQAFLQSVATTVDAFQRTAGQLASVGSGITTAAQAGVDQVNRDVAALQRVNDGLLRARPGSTGQASLMDERDRLLDSLSGALPVTVSFNDQGAASVRVGGSGGPVLLDGSSVGQLAVSVAAGGTIGFSVSGTAIAPASGSLSGLASAAATVAAQRTSLDQLAGQFASEVNAAHQKGTDANGAAGGALVSFGGTADTLTAVALTADQVAAADSSGDNGNMLAFGSLRGANGTEQGWAQMVSSQAQAVAAAKAEDAAASTRRDGANAARSELTSVDLDHEAAELLRFQQAYEGSARVIQVARETFQSILSAF